MGEVISFEAVRNGTYKPAPASDVESVETVQPTIFIEETYGAAISGSGKTEKFDYQLMMKDAVIGIAYRVLKFTEQNGLPYQSSPMLSFQTNLPGVEVSPAILQKWPTNIKILLDGWWEDLVVTPESFSVTLNFKDVRERMTVPFYALTGFQDQDFGFGVLHLNGATPEPPTAA